MKNKKTSSLRLKALWQTKAFREKMADSHRRPEVRIKLSETRKRLFAEGKLGHNWGGKRAGKFTKCPVCGDQVYIWPFRVRKGKKVACCSRACANQNRKDFAYGRGEKGYTTCKGTQVFYQSSWERAFLEVADKSKFISYVGRPAAFLTYVFEGVQRKYFPDFVVVLTNGTGAVIEIKPTCFIDKKVKAKFQTIRIFLPFSFRVVSEKLTSPSQLRRVLCKP